MLYMEKDNSITKKCGIIIKKNSMSSTIKKAKFITTMNKEKKLKSNYYACGRDNHRFAEFKYKELICKICNFQGHLGKVCKSKKKSNYFIKKINYDDDFINMSNSTDVNSKAIIVKLVVNDVLLDMELDRGADVSLLPEKLMKEKFKGLLVKPTLVKLKAYNGALIEPLGETKMMVCYKSVKTKM
uniref:Peptidase A2 domain-containing protein n=1 Tax=Schizaphis graminum TaxID=13262 RepID=A0A2S2NTZ4_SCHGA